MPPTGSFLCNRPHEKFVDFETSRFVVATAAGVKIGDRVYAFGEEVPRGSLSVRALRENYEAPPHKIDLLEYALTVPGLREACARNQVAEPKPEANATDQMELTAPNVESMTHRELTDFCNANGLSNNGTVKQLRQRVSAFLAG